MLNLVKRVLQEYDRVFLVTHSSSQEEWKSFCNTFLFLKKEGMKDRFFFLIEEGVNCPQNINFMTLSHNETAEVYKLYLTYEFSNEFTVFSDCKQYGTIFNYINTGIMTAEEVVKAILMH